MLIFGGSDPSNPTTKTLDVISEYDFRITVVLGPGFVYLSELEEVLERCKHVRILREFDHNFP